jgi:cell division protein FtsB
MARSTNTNFIVKFAVVSVLVILVFAVIKIQIDLNEMKQKKQELIEQIGDVGDTIEKINIRLDAPVTDDYIERVVRDELKYRMEGEIIFYNNLAN